MLVNWYEIYLARAWAGGRHKTNRQADMTDGPRMQLGKVKRCAHFNCQYFRGNH